MTVQEAIEKAIEGGWRPKGLNCEGHCISWIKQAAVNRSKFYHRYFLDPLFWQSLGKAMGWKRATDEETGEEVIVDPSDHHAQEVWLDKWHDFIDHIAEGKDAESFFANL